ncbi:hypothetical protein FIU90_12100 [Erythrobacter sp. THAF29]|nr:hypothetical protein FIU90_12100 [Erythrobacter sp. THAF29]
MKATATATNALLRLGTKSKKSRSRVGLAIVISMIESSGCVGGLCASSFNGVSDGNDVRGVSLTDKLEPPPDYVARKAFFSNEAAKSFV